ncbi:MAG: T9SS type A sorting domain-containing protein [Bacteroidia bacterium]|jgi:hypothetical protein|nr:T9SS type A sorting domain-containing protein [Bacteroidia bacterium]
MNTQTTFLKKAASAFCLLAVFTFSSRLHAQIIYTDIPDATPSASYSLDLNNDAVVDFIIQFSMTDRIMCYPQNSNAYSGDFAGGLFLPWALSPSTIICDSLATWYDSNSPGTMAWGTSAGYWVGQTDKYLALKLIVGTSTYYGWARLDVVPTSTSFTIKDYAYESTPDACIQSGQTTVGINENAGGSGFSIYPNPFYSSAIIKTKGNLNNATLTICNSLGQTVKQVNNISGQVVFLSRDNLSAGVYFVLLTEGDKVIAVEKIVIADTD